MNTHPGRSFFEAAASQPDALREYLLIEGTELAPADAILIFGNKHIVERSAWTAYQLYRQELAPVIIVSGGIKTRTYETEAHALKKELIRYGVPEERILAEEKSTNTPENVVYSRELAKKTFERPIEAVIGIGHITAARRFLMTLTKQWPEVLPMFQAVNPYKGPVENWHLNPAFKVAAQEEMAKIPLYRDVYGHIQEIDLPQLERRIREYKAQWAGQTQAPARSYTP